VLSGPIKNTRDIIGGLDNLKKSEFQWTGKRHSRTLTDKWRRYHVDKKKQLYDENINFVLLHVTNYSELNLGISPMRFDTTIIDGTKIFGKVREELYKVPLSSAMRFVFSHEGEEAGDLKHLRKTMRLVWRVPYGIPDGLNIKVIMEQGGAIHLKIFEYSKVECRDNDPEVKIDLINQKCLPCNLNCMSCIGTDTRRPRVDYCTDCWTEAEMRKDNWIAKERYSQNNIEKRLIKNGRIIMMRILISFYCM